MYTFPKDVINNVRKTEKTNTAKDLISIQFIIFNLNVPVCQDLAPSSGIVVDCNQCLFIVQRKGIFNKN